MDETTPSLAAQVLALTHLNIAELRQRWLEIFGTPTTQRHRLFLIKRLAWKMQADALGTELSPEAKQRLDELQSEFRNSAPTDWFRGARHNRSSTETAPVHRKPVRDAKALKVGTTLVRDYRGAKIVVSVIEGGFQYNGEVFRSLSAVAGAITNTHCSGRAFFCLTGKKDGEQ